ncbi:MAG: (d)CMP kinase [Fusobacteriaceae bacterium]|jgi:cytidylate kinase|nr:(d)CMP kinase [Fusobacteriaceae bacterium]
MKGFVIAIDGPAGSGKSTIAKLLAKKYRLTYLDTGAMYRMMALYTLEAGLDPEKPEDLKRLLDHAELDIREGKFYLNGRDVSEAIRTPEVSAMASSVSTIRAVREKLVDQQRKIGEGKAIVLDGRDIGTVVFPGADVKIYLAASPEERARRRHGEYLAKGTPQDYATVLAEIQKRDETDSTRKESPLRKADDAVEIDTSHMGIEEVAAAISALVDRTDHQLHPEDGEHHAL